METEPSARLILQRIRNRLIEYLEVVSSFDEQREYQRAVPSVSVPNEMINQWEDWVDDARLESYLAPVFSPEEQAALRAFHAAWSSVADSTPNPLPPLEQAIAHPQWEQLRRAGMAASGVFSLRGKLPEDREAAPTT